MEVTDLDKLQLMKSELTPSCCFGCQHMDGSYCVKPLKQKQVVSAAAFFSAFLPPFMTTFFLIPSNTKTRQSFIVKLLPPETYFLCCSPVSSLSPGGWSELSAAGDLRHREQIQQPRIKGENITRVFWLLLHHRRRDRAVKQIIRPNIFLFFFLFLSPGGRRRDQRQQRRVCGVFVGRARHAHPALQTPVSLQRLRRHAALPGQLLPHLQTA